MRRKKDCGMKLDLFFVINVLKYVQHKFGEKLDLWVEGGIEKKLWSDYLSQHNSEFLDNSELFVLTADWLYTYEFIAAEKTSLPGGRGTALMNVVLTPKGLATVTNCADVEELHFLIQDNQKQVIQYLSSIGFCALNQ